MPAQKGIKELEDELNSLKEEFENGVGDQEDEDPSPPKKRVELDEDAFVSAPSKKEELPEDEPNDEEKSWKKRYGDLRRHSQKQKESFEARISELEKSRPSGNNEPPTNPDDVKAWVEQYPQVAAIIQSLAEDRAKKLYGEDIQSLKKETEKEKRNRELARIYKAHDDFDEIKDDDKFHDWAEAQPDFIQKYVYQGTSDQVIWAVGEYKKSLEKRPDNDKEAAKALIKGQKSTPSTDGGKRRFLESEVEDMNVDEYSKLQDEIQEAIREGRFVYDLSGAAR